MPAQSLPFEVLRCLIYSHQLGVSDLLSLRATCKEFCTELAGKLPHELQYVLSRGNELLQRSDEESGEQVLQAVTYSCSWQQETLQSPKD